MLSAKLVFISEIQKAESILIQIIQITEIQKAHNIKKKKNGRLSYTEQKAGGNSFLFEG